MLISYNSVKLIVDSVKGVAEVKVDETKFFGYQILAVSVIWIGMSIFFKKMDNTGVIIYYVVTSWLLFLIVIFLKNKYREKKGKSNIVVLDNKNKGKETIKRGRK